METHLSYNQVGNTFSDFFLRKVYFALNNFVSLQASVHRDIKNLVINFFF